MNKNRTRRRWLIGISVSLAVVLCAAGAYAAFIYHKADQAIQHIAAPPTPTPSGSAVPSVTPSQVKEDQDKPISFLLTGVDSRGGSDGSMNTDVIMLLALNPKTDSATIVSLPRDLELKPGDIRNHKANYFFPYYYLKDKDTAFAQTKELYSRLFGVPIDYMAMVDFQGFRELVDELGGVRVNVDMDMKYRDTSDGTNIDLKKGEQTLDGKNALDFVRYRKSNQGTSESSDTARNERQQQVIKQILSKLTSVNGLLNLGDVLDIAGKNVKTDVPESELRSWIGRIRELKPDEVEFIHLNGEWISPYIVPKETDLKQALTAFRSRLGLEPEEANGVQLDRLADTVGLLPDSGTASGLSDQNSSGSRTESASGTGKEGTGPVN
ncbi:LCP family protein [Gorillibacterium timonense]|uniref:LCP family protein n=1 Tax=Gorillibacterium timonense TaxID=1689269 RepID=UPI0009EBC3A2|nr:LCP family protein [Gorillibacterium timonense]